jgi:hypothetical protein
MRDLTDPFLSFTDIADGASTTIEALSAFLARPDMQQRIKELENNIAARARVVATNALPSAVAAMQLINHAFAREERDHPLDTSSSPQAVERRRRFAETSRRATSLIIRIARVQGGPPPAPRPPRDGDRDTRANNTPRTPAHSPDEPEAPARITASDSQEAPSTPARNPSPPLAPLSPSRTPPSLADDATRAGPAP